MLFLERRLKTRECELAGRVGTQARVAPEAAICMTSSTRPSLRLPGTCPYCRRYARDYNVPIDDTICRVFRLRIVAPYARDCDPRITADRLHGSQRQALTRRAHVRAHAVLCSPLRPNPAARARPGESAVSSASSCMVGMPRGDAYASRHAAPPHAARCARHPPSTVQQPPACCVRVEYSASTRGH